MAKFTVNAAVDAADSLTVGDSRERLEWAVAAGLFVFALAVFSMSNSARGVGASTAAALLLFAGLSGVMLSLSVGRWRERLGRLPLTFLVRALAAPAVITSAIAIYSAAAGLPVARYAAAFGVYLALPALIAATSNGLSPGPVRVLAAATALWLPIEFDLLPPLRLPPPSGFRATPLVGLTNGLFLFLVASPVTQVGYTFLLRLRDVQRAVLAALAFAAAGVPIGLATGFLEWDPRAEPAALAVAPVAIYLATAVPGRIPLPRPHPERA